MNQAFREYATRVSFNISLSRNQIYCLWCLANRHTGKENVRGQFGLIHDMFVPGAKWLESNGLVTYSSAIADKNMGKQNFPWKLTKAGEHVLGLLKIAGLIPVSDSVEEAA